MNYKDYCVDYNYSILFVLKRMDNLKSKILIVLKENKFRSVISIGDIQRAIINNIDLNTSIESILRKEVYIAREGEDINGIKQLMKKRKIELMPVVSDDGELIKIIFWKDLFEKFSEIDSLRKINLPVVIMAGGLGSRLKPITNVLPKPLIPIGEKTIIEEIISRFNKYGCENFFISVNYKAEMIEYYLNSVNLNSNISYFKEIKPLGTAGSLYLLKNHIKTSFFVSNCDILIEQDYSEILDYHIKNKNQITIVAALKHFPIAYGILNTSENGLLVDMHEKPELTFKINSGMYILEPNVLDYIKEEKFLNITDLICEIKNNGGRVGVFPVSENSWKDIGDWSEYLKNITNT